MSHDEVVDTWTRKEHRAAYGKRQSAPRHVWEASDYLRPDFTTTMLIELLEAKARGYNGRLRELLCTSAAALRDQQMALRALEGIIENRTSEDEFDEVVNSMRETGELDSQGGM